MYNGGNTNNAGVEDPHAVYIRNVPTWVIEENRFFSLIRDWPGVDQNKSDCFPNKQNPAWNGWAVVYFKTNEARNSFLLNTDLHFVLSSAGVTDRLKVSRWIQKVGAANGGGGGYSKSSSSFQTSIVDDIFPKRDPATTSYGTPVRNEPRSPVKQLPLYKKDLRREATREEFEKYCSEASIHSFKGTVLSYFRQNEKGTSAQCGVIEIKFGEDESELVLFHAETVWLCLKHDNCHGTVACAVRIGSDISLPSKLPVNSAVVFTARKIPPGTVDSYTFQAKSVWTGDKRHPNFLTATPIKKLDEFIAELKLHQGSLPPPTLEKPDSGQVAAGQKNGASSSASTLQSTRQKPLAGGLKQLNSSLIKSVTTLPTKKSYPTNFAQAVASVPGSSSTEAANFQLELATVESFSSCTEAKINIPKCGTFTLDKRHFEKPFKNIQDVLTLKGNILVALDKLKASPGSYPSNGYFVVQAFPEESRVRVDSLEQQNGHNRPGESTPDTQEQPLPPRIEASEFRDKDESIEINLEDLDKYYDSCNFERICKYLEKELPKVLPNLANRKDVIEQIAHELTTSKNEKNLLHQFFEMHNFHNSGSKKLFVSEFLKFKQSMDISYANSECLEGEEENSPGTDNLKEEVIAAFLAYVEEHQSGQKLEFKIPLYRDLLEGRYEVFKNWFLNYESGTADYTLFPSWSNARSPASVQYDNILLWFEDRRSFLHLDVEFSDFISMFENDTNRYIFELSNEDKEIPVVKVGVFFGFDLLPAELEFVTYQERERETQVSILRMLIFLSKIDLTIGYLKTLNQQHYAKSNRKNQFGFQGFLHELIMSKSNPVVLDETNVLIQMNPEIKVKEHTPVSQKKLDKFVPILVKSLCKFLKDPVKTCPAVGTSETILQPNSLTQNSDTGSIPNNYGKEFQDFVSDSLDIDGEKVLMALEDKNISLEFLSFLHSSMREKGKMAWNFEVSKLQLNPPLGLAVPQIAEVLWSYFETPDSTKQADGYSPDNLESADRKVIESPLSDDNVYDHILSEKFLPKNCVLSYELDLIRRFNYVSISDDLLTQLQEGVNVMLPSVKSYWVPGVLPREFVEETALFATIVWTVCDKTSAFFKSCLNQVYKGCEYGDGCLPRFGELMKALAGILESIQVSDQDMIDVFTMLKLTLFAFDENLKADIEMNELGIVEKIFRNICSDSFLYNVDGIITSQVSDNFVVVETKYCKVLAHLGVIYKYCEAQDSPDGRTAPLRHWTSCRDSEDQCFLVGARVRLHCKRACDRDGNTEFFLALLAWTPVVDRQRKLCCWDPPSPGVILPVPKRTLVVLENLARQLVDTTSSMEGFNVFDYESQCEIYDEAWMRFIPFSGLAGRVSEEDWCEDLERIRMLFVASHLNLISHGEYEGETRALLASYTTEVQDCYLDEFFDQVEKYLKGERKSHSMIMYYMSAERKFGKKLGKSKLMNKFCFPSDIVSLVNRRSVSPPTEMEKSKPCNGAAPSEEKTGRIAGPLVADDKTEEAASAEVTAQSDVRMPAVGSSKYVESVEKRLAGQEELINVFKHWLDNISDHLKTMDSRLTNLEQKACQAEVETKGRIFVRLARDGDIEDMAEVPTNSNGRLPVASVCALFERTSAIKYRVDNSTKFWRILLLENDHFYPPEDGWGDRIYYCTTPAVLDSSSSSWTRAGFERIVGAASNSGRNPPGGLASVSSHLPTSLVMGPAHHSSHHSNIWSSPQAGAGLVPDFSDQQQPVYRLQNGADRGQWSLPEA